MMRATSLVARPLNTEQQREAVLQLFAREPWQASRQAVSEKTGIAEKSITWRIRELLDAKTLKELPAVDGKHPLQLIEHAPRSPHCDGNLTVLPAREIASHGARSVYVVPAGGYPWWQISRQTAQAIYDDGKRNGLYEFAEKRLALKS